MPVFRTRAAEIMVMSIDRRDGDEDDEKDGARLDDFEEWESGS